MYVQKPDVPWKMGSTIMTSLWSSPTPVTSSQIREHTISLRFLGIIFRVLRLEVSVYILYTMFTLQTSFKPLLEEGGSKIRLWRGLWIARWKTLKILVPIMVGQMARNGTPTKRQLSKRQVSKRPVSKRLKRQACKTSALKTSGLQNVRFTKCQVFKTSGCKKISIYILYLWLVEIRSFCCSHVCRHRDGRVLFSIIERFFAIYHHNG